MYVYKHMFVYAPAMEAAATTVFTVWLRASRSTSFYVLYNLRSLSMWKQTFSTNFGISLEIKIFEDMVYVVLCTRLKKLRWINYLISHARLCHSHIVLWYSYSCMDCDTVEVLFQSVVMVLELFELQIKIHTPSVL
jgi:hypothetical protein